MRYIVYLLLVANVLCLGWNLSQEKSVAKHSLAVKPMPASVHSLVMLNEQAVDTVDKTKRNKGVITGLHEAPNTDSGNAVVIAQIEQPDTGQAHFCKALGPFDKFDAAETVSDRLMHMGLMPMLRSVDTRDVDDYWVYLPGKGRQYSDKVIRKLKDKNISDYYVYESKDYLVSLGTFRRVDLAEKQQAMLQQMGIDALIEKRFRSRVEHWLELYAEGKDNKRLESIAMETPGLQIKTNSCMSLASR